jgi:hypothetical protein
MRIVPPMSGKHALAFAIIEDSGLTLPASLNVVDFGNEK